jgi:hypothetical protein
MDYLVHFEEKLFGRKLQSFLLKTPLKSFFRMVCFEAIFISKLPPHLFFDAKQTMWFVSRVNCPGWKLQLFLPKTPPKSFFRKTTFPVQFFFFWNHPPPNFLTKRTIRRVWWQNSFERKLCSLLPKMRPKSFFRKTRFQSELLYETVPSLIFWPKWTVSRVLRQNCSERKLCSWCFMQKRVKFSFVTVFPRNAPHSPFGPKNRWGSFIK